MYVPEPALRVLAEIIISANVGALHVQRVGEVLVARAEMNQRIMDPGERTRISGERLDDLLFRIADAEDGYIHAWRECEAGNREWRHSEGLASLDVALSRAAEYFREVASSN